MQAQQILRGDQIVGMRGAGFDVVQPHHQRVERGNALARREVALLAGRVAEGHGADFVAFLQRHVTEQHQRVERLVEVAAAGLARALVGAHAPAAVEHEEDALVAVVLEFPHDRLAVALAGLPVDVADRVAAPVFRQLAEVRAHAALRIGLDADLRQPPVAGEPGVAGDGREVGVDADVPRLAHAAQQFQAATARAATQLCAAEARDSASHGGDGVADVGAPARGHRHRLRQPVEHKAWIEFVEHLDRPGKRAFVHDAQRQHRGHAQRESVGPFALNAQRRGAPRGDALPQVQQQPAQAQCRQRRAHRHHSLQRRARQQGRGRGHGQQGEALRGATAGDH